MIGEGVSKQRFHPQMCSGKKTPKTGRVEGKCKNIVYIDIDIVDIDSDQVDDVVIIDYPEFMQQKSHGSSGKGPLQSVISIDDDDSNEFPGTVAEGGGELDSDASSSKVHFPPSTSDCHVVHERSSSSNSPECERTFSSKDAQKNRYGLNDESESGSSDSDCSDCELMEACEQWEKASFKRKRQVFSGQAGLDQHASSSGFPSNPYTNFEVENTTESHSGDGKINGTNFNIGADDPDQKVDQERSELMEDRQQWENALVKRKLDVFNNQMHDPDCGIAARNIIGEREKLKETDEYKRAIEEEWASRQRQLQIQAEEVRRLRKRKKDEKRLLEMQRRQKERIEEVRETQKKDEENMNMKEQIRVEIRKGLDRLEMTCFDMASLLCGLGIQVGGGFNPLPKDVRAAYKRALLKFHPDRASRTDIREQVEAEEKFKLISRMKEKFF
ncbi:hypothetical protein L6164_026996 [Bauhinia variegata]|uniref:Uncharacterized protein n=1 Tax=Bauhinia variegata TaxID=167791 RepID=A0ACB9LS09_BAUVA|nr:hypothetical protein L6164_026996 [Bauhinia variegata]